MWAGQQRCVPGESRRPLHYNGRMAQAIVHFAVIEADFPPIQWVEVNSEWHMFPKMSGIAMVFACSSVYWGKVDTVSMLQSSCVTFVRDLPTKVFPSGKCSLMRQQWSWDPQGGNRSHEIISAVTNAPYLVPLSAPCKPSVLANFALCCPVISCFASVQHPYLSMPRQWALNQLPDAAACLWCQLRGTITGLFH